MTIHFNAKPRPAGGLPPRRRATLAVRRGEHGHLRCGNPADRFSGLAPPHHVVVVAGALSIPARRRRVSTGACQCGRTRSRRLSCARTTRTGRCRSAAWLPESKPAGGPGGRLARRRIHRTTRRNSSVFELGPHLAVLIRGCEGRNPSLLTRVAFPHACPPMMLAVATSTCASVPARSPSRRRSWVGFNG